MNLAKNTKQDLFGVINVNKLKGMTSHDVVSKLRKILGIKQIGHTGTLDPLAVGVLPTCIGKATRIIEYFESSKAYRAYIKLGISTSTYDAEGEILETKPVSLNIEQVKECLEMFKGEIIQTPPIYSAVHYKGKRLYEYARKNIEIEDIPTRKVTINSIELINIPDEKSENPVLMINIDCSEGTYIRSIAHDLGEQLGCGAFLSYLVRTRAGRFNIDDAHTLEEIEDFCKTDDYDKFLINPVGVLPLEILEIEEDLLSTIKNGQSFSSDAPMKNNILQLICKNQLAAIASIEDNIIKPVKVFI